MSGTPIDRDKMRSIGVISGRTKPRVREGRKHPETGQPYKEVTDELNNTVTEHSAPGAPGVSNRQDVTVRPKTVRATMSVGEIG